LRPSVLLNKKALPDLKPEGVRSKRAGAGSSPARAYSDEVGDQNDPQPKTAEKIAEQQHVSAPTVKRAATFSEALDILEAIGINRHEITSGVRKLRQNAILKLAELAERDPDAARAAWAKVEAQGEKSGAVKAAMREVQNEQAQAAMPPDKNDLVSIILGDFRDHAVSLADGSIDAIITDPPYPAEYLPLWGDLARLAMRVLKPGGWCIVYSGKQHLDKVMAMMSEAGLLFYWQAIFLQTVTAAVHARAVNTQYKPILLFQKPPLTKPSSYFGDVIKGERVEKDIHEWQQSENGFEWLITQFTNAGDLILDPFCGAGTVPLVAMNNGRRCIAFEIDAGAHASACMRVFER